MHRHPQVKRESQQPLPLLRLPLPKLLEPTSTANKHRSSPYIPSRTAATTPAPLPSHSQAAAAAGTRLVAVEYSDIRKPVVTIQDAIDAGTAVAAEDAASVGEGGVGACPSGLRPSLC